MDVSTWLRKVLDIQVAVRNPRGRPRMTWKECVQTNMRSKGMRHNKHRIERRGDEPSSLHVDMKTVCNPWPLV